MNKKNIFSFLFFLLLLGVALLQVSFFSLFEHLRFVVQFFPLILLLVLLFLSPWEFLLWTIVSGLLLDFFSSFGVGTFILPLLCASLVVFLLSRFVLSAQVLSASLLLLFVFYIFFYGGLLLFSWIFFLLGFHSFFVSFSDLPLFFLGVQFLMNALLFVLFFFAIRILRSRFF